MATPRTGRPGCWPVVARAGTMHPVRAWLRTALPSFAALFASGGRVRQRLRPALPWILGILAAAGLAALALLLLGPLTWLIAGSTVRSISDPKTRADAASTVRGSVLTAAAGAVAIVALYFTARSYYLSRRGQVTDRYSKAIALLASDRLAERIGGIYALEHILRESPVDHLTVVDVLAAFIRDRAPLTNPTPGSSPPPGVLDTSQAAPWPDDRTPIPTLAADVQTALTVLARRPDRPEPDRLDLRKTDLRGAELGGGARFSGAHLEDCNLQGAYLPGAQLQGAFLVRVQLQGADLEGAQLQGAWLLSAQLQGADLKGAQLQRAWLSDTQLEGAKLSSVDLRRSKGLAQPQLLAAVWPPDRPPLLDDPSGGWIAKPEA